jgi:hypothetical protein
MVAPALPHWPARYETFYDAYYQELLAIAVTERWQKIDLFINLLIAITASGSAFSGLAWWSTTWGRPIWGALATSAAIGAICHATARIPNHLKQEEEARREFSLLRGKLQTILHKMTSDGDNNELELEFQILRTKLVEFTAKLEPDLAATIALQKKAQQDLDDILKKLGVSDQARTLSGMEEGKTKTQ